MLQPFSRSARALLACLALAVVSGHATAQPSRPIKIIIPSGAGGGPDAAMRLLASKMTTTLNQPIVIDNKVGAGGVVALRAFQGQTDDHTFLMTLTSTAAVSPATMKALADVDFARDFEAVAGVNQTFVIFVAAANAEAKSLDDMIRLAREKPGQVSVATPNVSSLANLAVTLLEQRAKVKFNVVPHARSPEALGAVTTGQVMFYADAISVPMPLVRAGRLKVIAVLSPKKMPGLEAYPIGNDTLPGFDPVGRFGLVAQKGTPRAIIDAVAKAAVDAGNDPEVQAKLAELGSYPLAVGPAEFRAFLREEADLWAKVIKEAGIERQ
jgi:tripartite-type tricarboxylate transporter receptor subunit TctC